MTLPEPILEILDVLFGQDGGIAVIGGLIVAALLVSLWNPGERREE